LSLKRRRSWNDVGDGSVVLDLDSALKLSRARPEGGMDGAGVGVLIVGEVESLSLF